MRGIPSPIKPVTTGFGLPGEDVFVSKKLETLAFAFFKFILKRNQ